MLLWLQVKLFSEKREDLEEQQLHLNVGLQKIRETVEQVEELQKSLSIKRNELEEKNNLANAKLKQMVGRRPTELGGAGLGVGELGAREYSPCLHLFKRIDLAAQ